MKRILTLIAALSIATAVFADDAKQVSKIFTVQNRDPHSVADAIRLLGSGEKLAVVSVNGDLRTITVRDYPENVAAMEQAIARLDQPLAAEPSADLRISVLIGSKSALPGTVPEDLAPVVKELQAALRYSHYALVTTGLQRVTAGASSESSGVIDSATVGATKQNLPVTYSYRLNRPSITLGDRPSLSANAFAFHMRAPFDVDSKSSYQDAGFETPVTIRDGESVVIGTTMIGDKALIVVVNARIGGK